MYNSKFGKMPRLEIGDLFGGGGGGGGAAPPTSQSVSNTTIPEYARPFVETMLGTAQQQIYNYAPDASGNMVPTTMKGYTPFSQDMNAYFAGFNPMQQQAFQGAANMGVSPELGQAAGLTSEATGRALQTGYQPGQFYGGQFGQGAAQQYMSPYMQSVVENQQREAQRQADIASTGRAAQATQAGAFGGSRQAIMDAEAARNLALQKGDIQSQGLQSAFTQAQAQYNADQARRMQAQQMREQSRQYGAGLGLQGLQTALSGAGQLGNIGQNIYGQQVGNIQLQNQLGGQQQQLEQAKINQQIQNYAMQQQYPMMQLANMSNLLRGLPMQATTVQNYQAQPSPFSQIAGLGATGIGAYGAMGGFKAAKGGSTKDIQKRPAGLAELALSKMA